MKGMTMVNIRRDIVGMTVVFAFALSAVLSGCGQQDSTAGKTATKTSAPAGTMKLTKSAASTEQEAPKAPSMKPITEERTYYDFESDLNGWEVPMWAQGKMDHIAKSAEITNEFAVKGEGSMKVIADFPGGNWSAALVEIQQYLDISNYRAISVDIYLPKDAPMGLNAKLILTIGDTWKFVEMSRSFPLIPGEWVTVTASIEPGSYDWKRVVPDEKFAEDIRKIAVRVESNRKPKYSGPIYIDNLRVGR